jgi:tripartite-type tricarboxylate transporter receptor subunit TctC
MTQPSTNPGEESVNRRKFLKFTTLAIGTHFSLESSVFAQTAYPNRPVRIIAPVQPGGGVDLVARTIAEQLSKVLGQAFVVENLAGGGGIVGSMAAKKSPADGYHLFLSYVGTHGTNPAVRKLPYDAIDDFSHIAMIAGTPNVLVLSSHVGASDLGRFIELAKKNGVTWSYGSSGNGTLTHLAMEQLKLAAGFNMTHVPYRGIGPALTDTIGNQVQCLMPGLAAALPHIRSGRIKAIAVTGKQRHPTLASIPTLEELGYPGFDGVQWYGLSGPARMSPELINRLSAEINKAIALEEVKRKFLVEALEPMPMSPSEYTRFIKTDILRWQRVARERNIQLDET